MHSYHLVQGGELRLRHRVKTFSPPSYSLDGNDPNRHIRLALRTVWHGIFYPKGLAQRRELEFASRAFNSIELNGSFYALQTPKSYATWYDESPEDFVFSIKGPRYITHIRRLNDVEGPLANFFASGILNLREKTDLSSGSFRLRLRADKSFVFPDRQALKRVRPAPPLPVTRWRSRDARPSAKSS